MFGRKAKKKETENINPDLKDGMLVNYEGEPYADYATRSILDKFDDYQKRILTAALRQNGFPVGSIAFPEMEPIVMAAMCLIWEIQKQYDDVADYSLHRVKFTDEYFYEIGQVYMTDYPNKIYCRDIKAVMAAAEEFIKNTMLENIVTIYKAGCPLFEMVQHPHIKNFDAAVVTYLTGSVRGKGYSMDKVKDIIKELEKTWNGKMYWLTDDFQRYARKCCYEELITVREDPLLNEYVSRQTKQDKRLPGRLKKDHIFDRSLLDCNFTCPVGSSLGSYPFED